MKKIGKTLIKPRHKLSCHCGGVELHIDLPDGLVGIRRCNCSLCARRGAAVASVSLQHLHLVKSDTLQLYQFNTRVAEHYFCNHCGIYTHHRRRSNPNEYGINIACLEGVNISDIGDIPWLDGLNNHPSDR